MANAFDRFDAPAQRPPEQSSGNPFDAFDNAPVAEQPEVPAPRQGLSTSRMFGVGPSQDAEYLQPQGLKQAEPAPEYDSFTEATGKSLQNVPERFQQSFGGLVQMLGEDMDQERERHMQMSAQRLGITPNEYKALAWAGQEGIIDPKTPIPEALESLKFRISTELTPEQQQVVADMGIINPQDIAEKGKDLRRDAKSTMKPVNAEPGSPEYYASTAIGSVAEMTPALIASALTRNPGVGMSIIGGQVTGESYGTARDEGLSVDESQQYALAQAAAEAIPEYLPIATLLRPGVNLFAKIGKVAFAESLQEGVTAALQAGIDKGTIRPDMTWGEARGLIADSMIVGGIAGPGMVAVTEPFNRLANPQPQQGPDAEGSAQSAPEPPTPTQPETVNKSGIDVTPTQAYGNNPFDQFDDTPTVRPSALDAAAETGGGDGQPFSRNLPVDQPNITTPPEQQQTNDDGSPVEAGSLTESGTGVFRVPVDQIQVDPEQYQFRSRVNDQGVDQRLSGVDQWDDNRAGTVLLHRREDGSLYVADGHHRVDLARRLGQGEINARIVDEADGVDVPTARVEAAMNNIADGKAEPLDVAKVFRDSGTPSSEVRSAFNLPNSQVVRDGEALANLSNNVFGMVSAGQMAEKDGAAIGAAFTEPSQQEAAADAFTKVQPETEYQRQLLVNEIRAAEFAEAQGEQGGLFGDDPQEVSLMQDRLKVLDALRQRLNSDKRLFKSLNDNADRAGEVGNQIATEANESITKQSARSLDLIGRVTTTPALNEMVNRAARRVYDGENRSQVVKDLKQELMAYEAGTATESSQRPATAPRRRADEGAGQEQRADQRVPAQDPAGEDQGAQPESGQREEVAPEPAEPTLELETQTEEQLAEQERTRQEAEQSEAQARREEEQRANADDRVDSFTLTGSDRTADVAMAAGQDDMFVSTPANRGSAEEVTGEVAGEVGSRADQEAEPAPARQSEAQSEPDSKPLSFAHKGESFSAESFADASAQWKAYKKEKGVKAKEMPNRAQASDRPSPIGQGVDIKDAQGQVVGIISYNGSVRTPSGELLHESFPESPKQPDQPIEDSGQADQETEDPRFSRTGPRNLFVAHNLSERNLDHVLELGGLAAPSLAVGRTDQGFSDFGEITLLAPSSMLESPKARTFDADVYTPRHPRAEYEIDRDAYVRQLNGLDNEYDLAEPAMDDLERDGMEAMARSPAYQYAWLKSQGKAPKMKRQKVEPVVRKIAKLGLDRFSMQSDPRVLKLAEAHYRDVQKQVREALGEDAPRANIYFNEDGSLNHSHLSQLTYRAARYIESGGYDEGQMKVDLNKKLRPKLTKRRYERWIKDQFNEVMEGQRIFSGFTPSGNRRYKPYNLENVVKEMTRQVQGGEGFNYGAGSVRSAYAAEMRRVSQVQANRDKIVSPEQMEVIKEESNQRLQETLDALKPYYKFDADGWGYMDDASSAIAEGPKGWREAFELNDESRAIITDFVEYVRNLPTAYFETKVGRAVDLAEFSVAIIPKGTSQEIVDALRAKGLKVKRYDPADPDSRREEIAKQEDLLFSRDGNYRRTPSQRTESLTKAQAESAIDGLMKGWKGAPKVNVAESISDFPKGLRDAIRQAQAEGDMRAVFWNDQVYVLAPRIPNEQALQEVILHEVVGHYGLRKMMGSDLKPLLNQVYMRFARTDRAKEIIRNYFPNGDFNASNSNHRLMVGEELLAHLAETNQHPKLWNRIVFAVREGLRKLGFTLELSETDLLSILRGAQLTVEQGGISRPSEADINFSRSERELSPAHAALRKSLYDGRDSLFDGDQYAGKPTAFADDSDALTDAEADLVAGRANTGNGFVEANLIPLTASDAQQAINIASSKQWYHGTADTEMAGPDFAGERALFLADDRSEAETYAAGGRVITHRIAPKNPLFVEDTDATLGMEPARVFEALRNEGYDSIIPLDFRNVVILSDDALANPDIRFSRAGDNIPTLDADPFGPPSDTIVRKAVSKIADKFTVLKGVQEQIKKTEGQIPEQADAYMAEELFHGKVENDIRLIRERMIEPLTERMAEYGVTLKQLDEFLYAMHAPERNRVIAERDPKLPDGGSGMTDAQAAEVIAKAEKTGKLGQYKELAGRVHRMLEMRRDILRDAGLLDEDTLGAWEASYRAYVPLKGFAADEAPDGRPRIGKGFAIAGKESQLAGGRRSRAASPVANSISDLSEAVLRHRKNEVGQAFMNLVQMYPNDSYWRIYSDENPEVERKPVRVKDPETGKMKVEVREQTVPMAMMSDRYFTTKVGGKTYYIKIEDQRLMNAMRNIGPDNNNILVRSLAAVTRVMSSLNTSYNPEFVISNFSRDIQTALLNLTSEQSSDDGKARGKKIAAKTLKDTGTAIRAINASLKGRTLTGKAGRWQQHFDQFRADGAKTGWFDMKDVDGQMRDMEKLVKLAQGGAVSNLRKVFRNVTDWVEHTNGAIENGVRLSAYVNAIEAGIPRAQAASLAKNMTVNFNRRGEWGTTMNAVYMFANASVQGTNNFIRTLGRLNGHKGDRIWRRMNTAQKIAAGMAVGGFMLSLLNRLGAGEDEDEVNWWDKVPDYIKERNIVVMKSLVGGEPGEYWTIPLPYGYNIFPVMGTQLEHLAFSENQSAGQAASNTILAALGSFSPIGFEESQEAYGTVIKNVTPTILRPIASISLNENFMGGPIFKENYPFGTPKPDSSLYFRSTPEMFKLLTKEINEATGGNEQMSGAADWSPDVMNYLVAYYGGGAYDFFTSRTPNFVTKALTRVELEDREVPFWRKIHGKVLPYEDQSIFYDRRDEINQLVERREALKPRERGPFVREYRDKLRLKPIMDSTEKRLRRLREQRDRIEMRDDLSMAEKDQRLQDVEARIKREIDRFNQRYNEADD